MKYLVATLAIVISAVFGASVMASGNYHDWMHDPLNVSKRFVPFQSNFCAKKYMRGTYVRGGQVSYLGQDVCTVVGADYSMLTNPNMPADNDMLNVLGILPHGSSDDIFKYVDYHQNDNPARGGVVYHEPSGLFYTSRPVGGGSSLYEMHIYDDLGKAVEPYKINNETVEYRVKGGGAGALYSENTAHIARDYMFTSNGKWFIYSWSEGSKTWIRKIDLSSGRASDIVLDYATARGYSLTAASNDGRYVYASTLSDDYRKDDGRYIFDTESCGLSGCLKREITASVDSVANSDALRTAQAFFSGDDSSLRLVLTSPGFYDEAYEITAYAMPLGFTGISYLALGDSFSSGEGDVGVNSATKKNYYREHTDDDGYAFVDEVRNKVRPTEQCHVSTRSYPYKLASGMELGAHWNGAGGEWGSVACSGALITDVNSGNKDSYKGQDARDTGKPRLQSYGYANLKNEAVNEMIPGRQEQVEFVRKYKPKVVTLTVGGNDAEFAKVIRACVSPVAVAGGEWANTCSYATDDQRKSNLANGIKDLQQDLKDLYVELLGAGSSDMKLFVLGYPVFVDDTAAKTNNTTANQVACGNNVRLNYSERHMIAEATKYLNKITQAAAREAGAIYISTTDAFSRYALCGDYSPKAVNGITGVVNNSESFHPNDFGHSLLAKRVWDATDGSSLIDYQCKSNAYVTCPDNYFHSVPMPKYFEDAMVNVIRAETAPAVTENVWVRTGKAYLNTIKSTLMSDVPFSVAVYSDRYDLGTYMTDSEGGFNQEITVPADIKPGYHTLEIDSTDIYGGPVKLWKIIEIRSEDPNDYDGDGIPNDQDYCTYIEPVGIDADSDGVDDGCDSEVLGVLSESTNATDIYSSRVGRKTSGPFGAVDDQLPSALLGSPQEGLTNEWNGIRKEALAMKPNKQENTYKGWAGVPTGVAVLLAIVAVSAILIRKKR